MPQVGFKPTIPVFERAKSFLALDSAATVIGECVTYYGTIFQPYIETVKFVSSHGIIEQKTVSLVKNYVTSGDHLLHT
jgi:hypothetical protein